MLTFTPKELIDPIPIELIKENFSEIYRDIDDGVFNLYFTNPSKFTIPDNTVFHIGKVSGVSISRNTHEQSFRAIYIAEDSIRKAFIDFIESVPENGLVYNKEASMEMLETFINE